MLKQCFFFFILFFMENDILPSGRFFQTLFHVGEMANSLKITVSVVIL